MRQRPKWFLSGFVENLTKALPFTKKGCSNPSFLASFQKVPFIRQVLSGKGFFIFLQVSSGLIMFLKHLSTFFFWQPFILNIIGFLYLFPYNWYRESLYSSHSLVHMSFVESPAIKTIMTNHGNLNISSRNQSVFSFDIKYIEMMVVDFQFSIFTLLIIECTEDRDISYHCTNLMQRNYTYTWSTEMMYNHQDRWQ